jgi:hypothetical protein
MLSEIQSRQTDGIFNFSGMLTSKFMVRLNTKVVVYESLLLLIKIEHHSIIELRVMNFLRQSVLLSPPEILCMDGQNFTCSSYLCFYWQDYVYVSNLHYKLFRWWDQHVVLPMGLVVLVAVIRHHHFPHRT